MFLHVVTKLDYAAVVRLDLGKMEDDIPAELLEKWYAVADQDRQDRLTNLVSQSAAKTFAGDGPTPPTNHGPKPLPGFMEHVC